MTRLNSSAPCAEARLAAPSTAHNKQTTRIIKGLQWQDIDIPQFNQFPREAPSSHHLLEINTLVDRQFLQETPLAVETHFYGAKTHPIAAADDAAATRFDFVCSRNSQAHGPGEFD